MVCDLLKKLSDAHGISGFEDEIRGLIKDEISSCADEIRTDALGNLIVVKKGSDFSVMLAAHMDEIGLMVQSIDEKGFMRVAPVGGWFGPTLFTQRVILHGRKGPVFGVVGAKPPHLMKEADRKKEIKIDEMFVDVGAGSAEEVKGLGIEIGTPATLDRECARLANNRITGKALDDRVGVAVLIETLRDLDSPHTVYGVFTVQEEVGLKGAKVSAYSIHPDCAIAIDTTIPGDHPGIEKKDSTIEIGRGPVIELASASGRGLLSSRGLADWLRKTADEHNIPYQLAVGTGGNTDASIINLVRDGIPSIPLCVGTRYIHSPVEVVDCGDIEATVRLLSEALKTTPVL
ncbi:MAG: M42 family metallopeptidase [Methanoculleaceae archaeon]